MDFESASQELDAAMNDNAADTVVIDAMGSYNGTSIAYNTEDMAVAGKINGALNFDVEYDPSYITTPLVYAGSGARTIAFWAKPQEQEATYGVAIEQGGGWDTGSVIRIPFSYQDSNPELQGGIYLDFNNESEFIPLTTPWNSERTPVYPAWYTDSPVSWLFSSVNSWHWYCIIVPAGGNIPDIEVYQDNILQTRPSPITGTINTTSDTLTIGMDIDYARYYEGVLDDVRFYDEAIDAATRNFIWNGGNGTETSLYSPPIAPIPGRR